MRSVWTVIPPGSGLTHENIRTLVRYRLAQENGYTTNNNEARNAKNNAVRRVAAAYNGRLANLRRHIGRNMSPNANAQTLARAFVNRYINKYIAAHNAVRPPRPHRPTAARAAHELIQELRNRSLAPRAHRLTQLSIMTNPASRGLGAHRISELVSLISPYVHRATLPARMTLENFRRRLWVAALQESERVRRRAANARRRALPPPAPRQPSPPRPSTTTRSGRRSTKPRN
jgi:hypothetical protein